MERLVASTDEYDLYELEDHHEIRRKSNGSLAMTLCEYPIPMTVEEAMDHMDICSRIAAHGRKPIK